MSMHTGHTPWRRRAGIALAVPALAITSLSAYAAPAQAAPAAALQDAEHATGPVTAGADWLAGQLADGLMYNPNFGGFNDYGLSIDAALALAAAGDHDAAVQEVDAALADHVASYTTGVDFDSDDIYAGALGKATVLAQTAGSDPTEYGGHDLVAELEDRVATAAPVTGRIEDRSEFGDYANVLGQAYAAQGLAAAGSLRSADTLAFLLQQQCSEGYFRLDFASDKAAIDQSCDGGKDLGESAPDTDATALVVLALGAQETDPVVGQALDDAEQWLLDQQRPNGAFGGGPTTERANTNSTGIAVWALGERGQTEAAELGAGWVRARQAVNVGRCAPWSDDATGAVAYNDRALSTGRADGITDDTSDQWRRATAQAVPALAWAPVSAEETHVLSAPGYVRAGRKTSVGVIGADPGATLCARRKGTTVASAANKNGEAQLRVKLPGRTGIHRIAVFDEAGLVDRVDVEALAGLKVRFVLKKDRVSRGHRQVVRVRGLAPAESVTVRFRGKRVATGQTDADGRLTRRFKVRGKPGNARVKVVGEFGNRKRAKTFTVTR